MSHHYICPDDYDVRREARRDAEDGWSRHRYRDECPDAAELYDREYRRNEYRIEEERAEEARAERARERRQEEEAMFEEECRQEQYWREYQAYLRAIEEDYIFSMQMDERVNADADPPTSGPLQGLHLQEKT